MFIGKIVKFIMKLAFGLMMVGAIIVAGISFLISVAKERRDGTGIDHTSPEYIIRAYEKNAAAAEGTWCLCPMPHEKDQYFIKTDLACCSEECEDKYWEFYGSWKEYAKREEELASFGVNP